MGRNGWLGSVVVYRNFVTYGTDCCVMCRYCFLSDSELRMITDLTSVKFDSLDVIVFVTVRVASLWADEVVYAYIQGRAGAAAVAFVYSSLSLPKVNPSLSCGYLSTIRPVPYIAPYRAKNTHARTDP